MSEFTELIDLASARLGGRALYATDEFFAPKENLLQPGRGVFIPDKYTEFGKWMDGWESRRKRVPGYDFCIIALGQSGRIRGLDVDTNHFLGNFPEHCAVDALPLGAWGTPEPTLEQLLSPEAPWKNLVPISVLKGGSPNLFEVTGDQTVYSHVRLNIFPDGGVARFRVHGEVVRDLSLLPSDEPIDLGAIENGGVALLCNDMFFSHKNNLLMPGRAVNMGDGWETRRKRGPGNDWIIVQLGSHGIVSRIEVDTNHFKGNFPESCSIEYTDLSAWMKHGNLPVNFLSSRSIEWHELLPRTRLMAHHRHFFETDAVKSHAGITHVRLSIYPDGGISRLRLWGRPTLQQEAV